MNDEKYTGSPPKPCEGLDARPSRPVRVESHSTRGWVQRTCRHRMLSNNDVKERLTGDV